MKIKELAEKYNDYIIERRRYYHQYPELSFEEVNTTKSIIDDLKAIGIEVSTCEGLNGCVGILKGAKPGPTVLLRADIDGLAVQEQTGLDFASKCHGKMHACGHDCHISMQLGAAKILSELKDEIQGNIKFFFQPGEEIAQGARQWVAKGLIKDVDACYGMHIWGQVDAPKINLEAGERMASCDGFTLTIEGTSAHGSAPHLGNDAIVASAAVVMNLQQLVSRVNNPLSPLVVSVGTMDGGQRFNIIANKVVMNGTVRTLNKEFRNTIEARIREIAELTAKAYGCSATLTYEYMTGVISNEDKELLKIAQNAAVSLYGEDILIPMEKVTGAEDFSFIMDEVPGVFGFLGGRSALVPGSELSNHHEKYTVDEDSLHHGAAIAAQFAYDYLKSKAK